MKTRWITLTAAVLVAAGCAGAPDSEELAGEAIPQGAFRGAAADTAYRFPGTATNVAVSGQTAYVAGTDVFAVLDLAQGGGTAYRLRSHDVAVDGNLVYVLDAVAPGRGPDFGNQGGRGRLSVIDFSDPQAPFYAAQPIDVPVGPFSGVAAANGRFVVSGGTSALTGGSLRNGTLRVDFTVDLGTGQPDVTLSPDGSRAFVSTDFNGNVFGITVIDMRNGATLDQIALVSGTARVLSGAGQFAPANFGIESAVAGNLLVTAHHDGLAAIDLGQLDRNPSTSPVVATLSTRDLGITPVNVDVQGNTAFVVGSSPRPQLVTVDLSTFQVTSRRNLGNTPTGVAANASQIVVASRAGLEVIDRDGAGPGTGPVGGGCSTPAVYQFQLVGTWNDPDVNNLFRAERGCGSRLSPACDRHFSAPVGATHAPGQSYFSVGGQASAGLEQVAEDGYPDTLGNELRSQAARGRIGDVFHESIGDFAYSPGNTNVLQFTATAQFPNVTVVSMVAPSPDWFVAARDVALCQNGQWVSQLAVELDTVYDAGTDDGESRLELPYVASPDFDRNPQAPISVNRTHFRGSLGQMVFVRVQ